MATPEPGPIPKEASEFFRRKALAPAFDHRDVWRDEHAIQFTVAKVIEAAVLASVQASLQGALDRGESYGSWVKNLRPELERTGWWGKRDVIDPETGEIREADPSKPATPAQDLRHQPASGAHCRAVGAHTAHQAGAAVPDLTAGPKHRAPRGARGLAQHSAACRPSVVGHTQSNERMRLQVPHPASGQGGV